MKVYNFGCDEDCFVFDDVYDNIDDFYIKVGSVVGDNILSDDSIDEDEVDIISYKDSFDSSDEYKKFVEVCMKYNDIKKLNNDSVLISYYVEYDSSWLLLSKDDYNKLKDMFIVSSDD